MPFGEIAYRLYYPLALGASDYGVLGVDGAGFYPGADIFQLACKASDPPGFQREFLVKLKHLAGGGFCENRPGTP